MLQRVAFSANIKERRDFSCALFDSAGELLAQAAHIPVHLGSMPASVAAVRERLGALDEGDVAIVNDPFAGGTHLPDITIVSPVYRPRRALLGYAANRAHHADVGGVSPGSMTLSRHIDEEGIRIEPSLLVPPGRAGRGAAGADPRGRADAGRAAGRPRCPARGQPRRGNARCGGWSTGWGRDTVRALRPGAARLRAGLHRPRDRRDPGRRRTASKMCSTTTAPAAARSRSAATVTHRRRPRDRRSPRLRRPGRRLRELPDAVTRSAVYYCFACLLR